VVLTFTRCFTTMCSDCSLSGAPVREDSHKSRAKVHTRELGTQTFQQRSCPKRRVSRETARRTIKPHLSAQNRLLKWEIGWLKLKLREKGTSFERKIFYSTCSYLIGIDSDEMLVSLMRSTQNLFNDGLSPASGAPSSPQKNPTNTRREPLIEPSLSLQGSPHLPHVSSPIAGSPTNSIEGEIFSFEAQKHTQLQSLRSPSETCPPAMSSPNFKLYTTPHSKSISTESSTSNLQTSQY
jgi:hypothetical protein